MTTLPTFVSSVAIAQTYRTDWTINAPAGIIAGDVLIASISQGALSTVTPPSGWVQRLSTAFNARTLITFYKLAGASEPATYTFTLSAAIDGAHSIAAFRGADPAAAPHVEIAGTARLATVSVLIPGMTTTVANCLAVWIAADNNEVVLGVPAGATMRAEAFTATAYIRIWMGSEPLAASGATGTRTATTAAAVDSVAHSIALAPIPDATVGVLVQSKKVIVNGQASTTLTFDATPTAGSLIVVAFGVYGSASPAIVTDNKGNGNYTQACFAQTGADQESVWLFYKENVISSAGFTITVDPNGASSDITLVIMEFGGMAIASPLDVALSTGAGSSTTPTSNNITTTANSEILIGVLIHAGTNRVLTPGAGWTQVQENEGGSSNMPILVEYRTANIGTYAATFAMTGAVTYRAVVAAFKSGAGGGGPTTYTQVVSATSSVSVSTSRGLNAVRSVLATTLPGATVATKSTRIRSVIATSLPVATVGAAKFYVRVVSVASPAIASLSRTVKKAVSSLMAGLASVGQTSTRARAVSVSLASAVSVGRQIRKILSVQSATVASVANQKTFVRLISPTSAPVASLSRTVKKAVSSLVAGLASVGQTSTRARAVSVSLASAVSVGRQIRKILSVQSATVAITAQVKTFVRTVAANGSLLAGVLAGKSIKREVSAAASSATITDTRLVSVRIVSTVAGVVVFTARKLTASRAVSVQLSPIALVSKRLAAARLIFVQSTGLASVLKTLSLRRVVSVIQSGVATLSRGQNYLRSVHVLAVVAVSNIQFATKTKTVQALAATGATVQKMILKIVALIQVSSNAQVSRRLILAKNIQVVSSSAVQVIRRTVFFKWVAVQVYPVTTVMRLVATTIQRMRINLMSRDRSLSIKARSVALVLQARDLILSLSKRKDD